MTAKKWKKNETTDEIEESNSAHILSRHTYDFITENALLWYFKKLVLLSQCTIFSPQCLLIFKLLKVQKGKAFHGVMSGFLNTALNALK